mgnify:CR=1 FL=1
MVKTIEAVVRKLWLSPENAVEEVVRFERRFGEENFKLACHCGLFLILTPELVNLIRINFLDEENIPWIGESNFLLSSLCRPLQEGVYEVEPCVREVLLEELEDKFGWRRPFELAEFLWFYLDKQGERKPSGELRMVQEWIAQAYLDPDRTIREMESFLSESLPEDNPVLGLAGQEKIPYLVEILAQPLEQTNLWKEYQNLVLNSHVLAKLLVDEKEGLGEEIEELKEEFGDGEEVKLGNEKFFLIHPVIKKFLAEFPPEKGIDYICEAKLLIVGEAGAGKTALANKIINPNYQLKDEDTTKGIEVYQYNFKTKNQNDFQINIWDFGGQEIYHTTHQFFLTKRSLYILVVDTRKEDTDFYYWLNVVELLSDNSPLLIVKNEKHERQREINQRGLQGQFTNIKEILATNLETNRGLEEIIREIEHHISELPHIGSSLPKTWKQVREILELDSRNYISLEEYLSICEQNGFEKREYKLQLSGYLHDLGICLHFQDDPLLNKTVILKPEWGIAAVYKILDNPTVYNNFGKFTKDDLTNIWNEEKYVDMRDELLQLMIRFKLCYKILGNSQTYIAPQLLTENQPEYDWDENNNLILRYTYKFMPRGIITQFIVDMHRDIEQQKYVWKRGVIIKQNETRAEVIEYYDRREIKIRVSGRQKRALMTLVTYLLDKIHSSYNNRLKYNHLFPCTCAACKNSQNPHFYKLEKLKEWIRNGRLKTTCENHPYNEVNIKSLIDNVINIDLLSKLRYMVRD